MRFPSRKGRRAFRPSVADVALEERVVLSVSPAWMSFLRGPSGPVVPPGGPGPSGPAGWTTRDLATSFGQHFGETESALRQYVNNQIATLYGAGNLGANGRPTAAAIADFTNNVGGAINAATLGLSSQVSLLPGAGQRLLPALQQSLQGDGFGSLTGGIGRRLGSAFGVPSQRLLQNMINRQISSTFLNNSRQVGNFLRSPQLSQLSIDPTTGQAIPLSQFMQNQAALQINNTLGALANSVGGNAGSSLFDATGAFNPAGVSAFQQQFGNALNSAAFQINGVLSALPNSSAIRSGLQSSFFGTGAGTGGTPAPNFFNSLSGVFPTGTPTTPFTTDAFNTAFQNGFTTAFQNFNNQVGPFLGQAMPVPGGPQLPTGFFQSGATFPSVLGPQFTGSAFNSGFNNGFATTGTGFPGFGTAPSGFNSAFGTGFNNFITGANGLSGITGPGSATIGGSFGGLTPTM